MLVCRKLVQHYNRPKLIFWIDIFHQLRRIKLNSIWTYLPTFRVFPIKIESIKSVLIDENHGVFNETASGCWIVDHDTVFTSSRIVPSSQCNQNFDAVFLESHHLGVEARTVFIRVWPGIKDLHDSLVRIQRGESVQDVSAQIQINVSRSVFGFSLPIPRPICIVTNDFSRTCFTNSNQMD